MKSITNIRAVFRLAGLLSLLFCASTAHAQIFLPGTQPQEHSFKFRDVAHCYQCHSRTSTNGAADPFFSWQGGMMAHSARDPVFRAALAIANQDLNGSGEFCIRCHSPRGWLEGRSSATDASLLKGDDLNGVSCDVCHQMVDPLSEAGKKMARHVPPGYGNGMMVIDPAGVRRGPYEDAKGVAMHAVGQSAFLASSELCGTCHNVSNPTLAVNVTNQPPHAYGHIERTYSEWSLSDFAKPGSLQTCQSCHFPRVEGGGRAVNYSSSRGDTHRDYFVSHAGVGTSTWVQDAIIAIWGKNRVDADALQAGKERARQLLKTAAALDLQISGNTAQLTITNLTGHKLPTGYPEGRRMWVNVRFLDRESRLLAEVGAYGDKQDTLRGEPVRVPTLLDPESTRVYECKPAISTEQAAKTGKPAGPSFHFVLNDYIAKDNRIPPRGFKHAAFQEHLAAPVGATYADGQYWDQVQFPVPAGTEQVEARLMYQSVSWEYLKFLVETNQSDDWGTKLYQAWSTTGKCPPEEMGLVVAHCASR